MSVRELSRQTKGSWRTASLNELGQLYCGQSPPSSTVNANGIGTLYVSGPEQWDGHKIRQDKWTNDPKRLVPDGCIFITVKGAGVGKIFPGISCSIGRDIYAFKPKDDLSAKFIEHAIRFTVQDVLRHAVGDIPGLSKAHILQHEIGIPEPQEQERIVAEIEKQFSRLDEAIANLKRVKANLKRYKAAVLKAAVEGRLTEDWRKQHSDVEPASKLLERTLAERRAKWSGKGQYNQPGEPETSDLPTLPDKWLWARLDAIAALKGGITVDKNRKSPTARAVPYLRVANVQRGYLDLSEIKTIGAPDADIKDLCLIPGDILFNEGGDRDKLGRGWLWEGQLPECIHQNHVFRARVYLADVSPKLVSWWGNSFGQAYFLREGKQTTNLASLNLTKLSAFPIPLPPAAEQQQIVAEVERRLSVIEELEATVESNLTRADRLRQSILAQAFSGSLRTN